MKAIKFLVTLVTLVMVFSTCSENDNVEPGPIPADTVDESLTDEQAAFLETVKDTVIHLEDIILEDGQNVRSFLETNDPDFLQAYPSGRVGKTKALTPREQKLKFLARMLAMGNYLTDDDRHTYPSAGADSPAQTGLAYSWGSKDYTRQVPPGVTGQCKDLKIYGLDCSGMLWAMTQAANLTVVPKYNFFVEYISNADKWTAAFKASADYKDLKMKNMGQLTQEKMKNGDIILWGDHVGVYLYGSFYQSNGSSKLPKCRNNLNVNKGPRCISLTDVLSWKGLGSFKVFRVTHGEDYTITLAEDNWKVAVTSIYCVLMSDYRDSTVIDITVKADGIVVLNSIKNSTPLFTYSSEGCTCFDMTFTNGSIIEYTDFRATTATTYGDDKSLLEFEFTYTWCSSTDRYQCLGDPEVILPGLVISGVESGNMDLPQDQGAPIVGSWNGNGTITVERKE